MQINIFDNSCNEKIVSGNLVKLNLNYIGTTPILNIYIKNAGFAQAFPLTNGLENDLEILIGS